MKSFATRCCAEMAGDARHAARRQILRFITGISQPVRQRLRAEPDYPLYHMPRQRALGVAVGHLARPRTVAGAKKLNFNSGDRNEAAQRELHRIQIAVDRVAESLQAIGSCARPSSPALAVFPAEAGQGGECPIRLRAGQYWRLEKVKSFDEFLERRFPESRRKAYYLMSIHE